MWYKINLYQLQAHC